MTIVFNGDSIQAVTVANQPTIANSGPFNSVATTSSTITVETDISHPIPGRTKAIKHQFSGASAQCQGVSVSNLAIPSTYSTITHNFWIYIDTIASTATVLNLAFVSVRYCIYLCYSSGWKIAFSLLHNSTSAKIAVEATSAAMTTGAWHNVKATYRKISASIVDLILEVDGVVTTSLNQSNANLTVVGTTATYRIGPASQMTFSVNASNGDKIYTTDWFIEAQPVFSSKPERKKGMPVGQLQIGEV